MIAAFTGHRPDKIGFWDPLHPAVLRVKAAIRRTLVELWPAYIISGMALGTDQWAAQEAVDLGIPFVAALPCDDMDARWPLPSRERFQALLKKARQIVVVAPGPYQLYKMQKRNQWMVDNCDLLLAVHDGTAGGTLNCIDYACQMEREVKRLEWQGAAPLQ